MDTSKRRTLILGLLVTASLLLAACTRSASDSPVPTVAGGGGEPTAGAAEATMEAVRSAILTQTAQAAQIGGGEEPTATEEPPQPLGPTDTPPATSTPVPTATATGVTVPVTYTVQTGDWIYSIARKFGLDPNAVIAANPGVNPNLVIPGQVLNLPQPGATPAAPASTLTRPADYTVKQGDWIYSIARAFGVTPEQIIAANPTLRAPYTIYPGQVLHIP